MVDPLTTPKRSSRDAAHAVVRAALGSLPVIGAAGSELFSYLVEEPIGKRREEWMHAVGEALDALRAERAVDLHSLRADPEFIDTLLQATYAALRSHETEKHEALRNAVLNSALPDSPEGAIRQTFIRCVDEFTPWHLRLLDLFDDAKRWQQRNSLTFPPLPRALSLSIHLVDHAFPQLRSRPDLYELFWRDLHVRGLVHGENFRSLFMEYDLYQSQTTSLGKQFLQFVREPA